MNTALNLGDTVTGNYHGVAFTGTVHAYDGSGYLYVKPVGTFSVYGVVRDQLAFEPRNTDRASLRVVARPEVAPELREYPYELTGLVCVR